MRSFTPALAVILAGLGLMLGSAEFALSGSSRGGHAHRVVVVKRETPRPPDGYQQTGRQAIGCGQYATACTLER